jgi:hypothetical protein
MIQSIQGLLVAVLPDLHREWSTTSGRRWHWWSSNLFHADVTYNEGEMKSVKGAGTMSLQEAVCWTLGWEAARACFLQIESPPQKGENAADSE